MKIKEWFKLFLSGAAIGVGSAIPGVSGGTIAVILRVYEKIVHAVSHIFKEFKRSIIILVPIILGLVVGIIPTIILMDKALEGFVFGVICIFAGFIIGSFPRITSEVKGEKIKKLNIIILVLSALLAIGLGVGSVFAKGSVIGYFYQTPVWFYFVLIPVGLLASCALVVPGISGGMILILLGFYKPLIMTTTDVAKECLHGNWSHFGNQIAILGCFFIGILIGFFIVSKTMNYLLRKYRVNTFYGIIGFVLGSIFALFFNFEIYEYYQKWSLGINGYLKKEYEIIIGVILLVVFAVLSYLLVRYENKKK